MRHARLLTTAIFLSLFTAQPVLGDAPHVVTSVKPLELLVRAVASDDTTITSLVSAGASPHTYQMRPSQRRALEAADRIFWVGPDMETFLVRILSSDEFTGRQVALMAEDPTRHHDEAPTETTDHEPGHHDEENEHGDNHHHGDGEDPHIWLDPQLALAMARDIRNQLASLDGADRATLDANLARFEHQLMTTEQNIRQRLKAAHAVSLFTYHDAFRRFAEHYGLEIAGVLTLNPERSPGARHIAELQQQLMNSPSPCLLTEPQFNRQWWRSITADVAIATSSWDPLASDIEVSTDGYLNFQNAMAEAVLDCLPEQAQK